ncbi:MAG: hypothetical protein H6Q89_4718 [Myxococcaceae bacterium]|nr:hypothetical protein [Myxococcaceae bacterium]
MAIPPDPIEEVLPAAQGAVMAEVTRVVKQDADKSGFVDPKMTSAPTVAARQIVELKVSKVLFGEWKAGSSVQVVKPAGAYALRPGNKGPFLLTRVGDAVEILGAYGPDTYPEPLITQTATRLGKK